MDTLLLDPIVFSIGSLSVRWYGLILGAGALIGLLFAIREGKRFGIPQEFFMDMLLFGAPSAIVVARIYYVAFQWDNYKNNLWGVFKIWEGGIAIYGALIGAVISTVILARRRGYSFWRIADISAPGLIAAQMIGRWGNFVNQEAYGGETTLSFLRDTLHLPSFIINQMYVNGVLHHPTFLYESVWNLGVLVVLLILRRVRNLRKGELFISYFLLYSVGRFFIEALRLDSLAFQGPSWLASFINGLWSPMTLLGFELGELNPAYGNIRISQLLPIIIIIVAIVSIVLRRKLITNLPRYSDPVISTITSEVDSVPAVTVAGQEKAAIPVKVTKNNHPGEAEKKE